jgi:hypothetical protein
MEALQLGAVHMLAPSLAKFGPLGIRDFEVFDLPFMFGSYADLHKVTTGPVGKQLLAKLEETDADGYGYCVSCGKLFSWTELNGGHYQPKGTNYNGACLDERNIHAQCVGCNVHKGGNPAGYTGYMVRAHGLDVIDELKQKSYRLLDRFDVLDFIRATAEECKAMAKEKTFRVNFPPIPKDAR